MHSSSLSTITWANPTNTIRKYYSVGMQVSYSSSNIFRLLFKDEPKGDALIEESIGLASAVQFRTKQWTIPIDVGINIMPIITSSFSLINFGMDAKYTIVSNKKWISSISLGLVYAYTWANFEYTLQGLEYSGIDKAESDVRIKVDSIRSILTTQVHSIAGRVQANKRWYFIEPYVGLEPALYIATSTINTEGGVYISKDRGTSYTYHTSFSSLTHSFLEAKGFLYENTSLQGTLRGYAGILCNVYLVYIDIQVGIDAITWQHTGSFGIKVVW